MKRTDVFYRLVSIIAVFTLGFVSIIGTSRASFYPCTHFFRNISTRANQNFPPKPIIIKMLRKEMIRNALALSETQQTQINQQLLEMQISAARLGQELKDMRQAGQKGREHSLDVPTNTKSIKTRRLTLRQKFREIFNSHASAILRILSPDQLEKLRKRGVAKMLLYELGAKRGQLFPIPQTPKLNTLIFAQIGSIEEDLETTCKPLSHHYFQKLATILPPTQRLQQSQILRI